VAAQNCVLLQDLDFHGLFLLVAAMLRLLFFAAAGGWETVPFSIYCSPNCTKSERIILFQNIQKTAGTAMNIHGTIGVGINQRMR
jgi:hypothetical protein